VRLLVIGTRWPPETFIARRLAGLARAGFGVVVAATGVKGSTHAPAGVGVIHLPRWNTPVYRRLWDLAGLLFAGLFRAPRGVARISMTAKRISSSFVEFAQWLHRLLPFCGVPADVVHFEWNSAAVELLPLFDLQPCPVVVSCRGSQVHIAPHNPHRRVRITSSTR